MVEKVREIHIRGLWVCIRMSHCKDFGQPFSSLEIHAHTVRLILRVTENPNPITLAQ